MKRCPHCHSIVDDEYECKICGATITYEPPVSDHREKYAPGRDLLLYRLKQFGPALLGSVIALPLLILSAAGPLVYAAIALLAAVWIEAALQHRVTRWMQWKYSMRWKYSKEYVAARGRLYAVLFAVLAVLIAAASYMFG